MVVPSRSADLAGFEVRSGLFGGSDTYLAHRMDDGIIFTHGGAGTPPVSLRMAKRLEEALRGHLERNPQHKIDPAHLVFSRANNGHLSLGLSGESESTLGILMDVLFN